MFGVWGSLAGRADASGVCNACLHHYRLQYYTLAEALGSEDVGTLPTHKCLSGARVGVWQTVFWQTVFSLRE